MPVPEEHRIKWEAEVSTALMVWTNGRDPAETLDNGRTDGIIDIDDVWAFLDGDDQALVDVATIELQAFLEETLYEEYLRMKGSSSSRVASRHMKKTGIDKFG